MSLQEKIKIIFLTILFFSILFILVFIVFINKKGSAKHRTTTTDTIETNTLNITPAQDLNFHTKKKDQIQNKDVSNNKQSRLVQLTDEQIICFDIVYQDKQQDTLAIFTQEKEVLYKTISDKISTRKIKELEQNRQDLQNCMFVKEGSNVYLIKQDIDSLSILSALANIFSNHKIKLPSFISSFAKEDRKLFFLQESENGFSQIYKIDQLKPLKYSFVKTLPFKGVSIYLADNKIFILIFGNKNTPSQLLYLDEKNNLKSFLKKKFAIELKPVKNGFFLSYFEDGKLKTKFLNKQGQEIELPVSTFAKKCVESENTFYCFVPKTKTINAYYNREERVTLTEDELFIIKKGENKKQKIDLPVKIDAENVIISKSNNLYFKNRYDEKLYKIRLSD